MLQNYLRQALQHMSNTCIRRLVQVIYWDVLFSNFAPFLNKFSTLSILMCSQPRSELTKSHVVNDKLTFASATANSLFA